MEVISTDSVRHLCQALRVRLIYVVIVGLLVDSQGRPHARQSLIPICYVSSAKFVLLERFLLIKF